MKVRKLVELFKIFILSFIDSILILSIPVLLARTLKPINQEFLDLLVPIARPPFMLPFRSNDTRNYLLGIIIFTSIAFLNTALYWILSKKFKKFILPKLYAISFFIIFTLFGIVIAYKTGRMGWDNVLAQFNLAYNELLNIKIYSYPLSLVIASFISIYLLLRTKIFLVFSKIKLRVPELKIKFIPFVIDAVMLILIVFLLYNPRYQYSYEKISNYGGEAIHQFHHGNFFIAPVNEVINGKMLLVNAQAQYGILLTYFQSIILSVFGLSYANFNLYNIIISIIYVLVFYIFLSKITNSRILAVIGTIGFIKLSFFRVFWPYEIYTLPSTTPLRYFFDILAMFAVFILFFKFTIRNLVFTSVIIALAFFYNTEIGLSILLAYTGINGIYLLLHISNKTVWIKTIITYLFLTVAIILIGSLISIISFIRVHQFPDWILYFRYVFIYGRGAFDVPMPLIGSYYFVIFIYIITFYLLLFKAIKRDFRNFHIMLFILIYGILNFFYYLVFSEPHHFLTIIHPSILLSIILISQILRDKKNLIKLSNYQNAMLFTFFLIVIGYLFWSPLKAWDYLLLRLNNRYGNQQSKYNYWNYNGTFFYLSDNDGSDFFKSADEIKSMANKEKDIVILSRYDTILYMMTGKTSLIGHPISEYDIGFIKEREGAINQILKKKPPYVFVFSEKYNTMVTWTNHEIWDAVKNRYTFVKNAGVIDIYKLNDN